MVAPDLRLLHSAKGSLGVVEDPADEDGSGFDSFGDLVSSLGVAREDVCLQTEGGVVGNATATSSSW